MDTTIADQPVGTPDATSTAVPAVRRAGPPEKILELEGVRGIAALLIIFYHLPYWNSALHALPIVDNGSLMVELFFVLSGFVICGAYRLRLTTPAELLRFQILRLGRLYPVHLLFLGFFLLAECAKAVLAARYGITSNNSEPFNPNSWSALAQQLLLVHSLGPFPNALTFNSPAWSIGVEFYTYLVFGLIVLAAPSRFVPIAVLVSAGAFVLLVRDDLPNYLFLLKCLAGFFLGCCVRVASEHRRTKGSSVQCTLALAAMLLFLGIRGEGRWHLLIFPLSAALVYAIVTTEDGPVRQTLRSRPMAWLGRISYSVYMAHLAVIWIMSQLIRFALDRPGKMSPTGHIDAQLGVIESLVAAGLVFVLTLTIGHLVCRFVEEPLRDRTRRWVSGPRGVALAPVRDR